MQVMEERLTREKICSLRCLEDIVHAFGSVDKELQIAMNEQVARCDFANLTLQRIGYSCFMLRTFYGEVSLLPQQGGSGQRPFFGQGVSQQLPQGGGGVGGGSS